MWKKEFVTNDPKKSIIIKTLNIISKKHEIIILNEHM
jgi:hypothetical protein